MPIIIHGCNGDFKLSGKNQSVPSAHYLPAAAMRRMHCQIDNEYIGEDLRYGKEAKPSTDYCRRRIKSEVILQQHIQVDIPGN